MARQVLPTNFKDDVLAASMGGKRRYILTENDDGTFCLEDATTYTQEGSALGAARVNEICGAINESVDQATVVDDVDEIKAITVPGYVPGTLPLKQVISDLGGYSFGETTDGQPGYRKPGADTVYPFSSGLENVRFYMNNGDNGAILSFKVRGKSTLTFALNNNYIDGGYYPQYDYLEIYDGQPTYDNYTSLTSGLNKIATLSKESMTDIDASAYIAQCTSGYMTLRLHAAAASKAICYVKDIVLR